MSAEDFPAPEVDPETDANLAFLPPEHPSLAGFQSALLTRVARKQQEADARVRDQAESVRRLEQFLDDLGASLYVKQQQLTRQQSELSAEESLIGSVQAASVDLQSRCEELAGKRKNLEKEARKTEAVVGSAVTERQNLVESVQKLELYNSELLSSISVHRRATEKTEEALSEVESVKMHQDNLIQNMNEQIFNVKNEINVISKHIGEQKSTNGRAKELARSIVAATDEVRLEHATVKRQIGACLVQLSRRDEAYSAALKHVMETENSIELVQSEIRGMEEQTAKLQQEEAKFNAKLTRVENQKQLVMQSIAETEKTRKRLAEEYVLLKKSLEVSVQQSNEQKLSLKEAEIESQELDRQLTKLQHELTGLEDEYVRQSSENLNVSKEYEAINKTIKEVKTALGKIESEIIAVKNEKVRVELDTLNAKAANVKLKERLLVVQEELAQAELLNKELVGEIKKRTQMIEKKQLNVDKLNRLQNSLLEQRKKEEEIVNVNAANLSIEGKIRLMKRQIAELVTQIDLKQRRWQSDRGVLLTVQTEIGKTQKLTEEASTKHFVYKHKVKRSSLNIENLTSTLSQLEREIKQQRFESDRISAIKLAYDRKFDQFKRLKEQIAETSTVQDLVKAGETVTGEIGATKTQLLKLTENIVAVEGKILDLEQKITVETEMQQSLNTEFGQEEVLQLQSDLHRKEMHHAELQRIVGDLARQLEKSVAKKDTIELKFEKPKVVKTALGNAAYKVLQKKLNMVTDQLNDKETKLTQIRQLKLELDNKLQHINNQLALRTQENAASSLMLEGLRIAVIRYASFAATLRQAVDAAPPPDDQTPESATAKLSLVLDFVQAGRTQFPRYEAAWRELQLWAQELNDLRSN